MRYNFEWDSIKARANLRKHGVSFERATELFLDPLAVTVLDRDHSEEEERWVTVGEDSYGRFLVLIHTFSQISAEECKVRIISARKANRREARQYEEAER